MRTPTILLTLTVLCLGCGQQADGPPASTGDGPPALSTQPQQTTPPEASGSTDEASTEKADAVEVQDKEPSDPSASKSMPHGAGQDLHHMMQDQLAELREKLKDEDPEVRMKIVEGVWRMGKMATWAAPALGEVSNDEDVRVRSRVMLALLEMEKIDPEGELVMPALLEALKDESPVVRSEAVNALAPKGTEVMPQLVQLLENDKEGSVRAAAARALGPIGSAALPTLVKALEGDEDEAVRASAAGALAQMGPEAKPAMPALVAAIRDEKRGVRLAAANALVQIGADAVADLTEALNSDDTGTQLVAARALGQMGTDGFPALVEALENGNMFAKFQAASVLGFMGAGANDAIPALEKLLDDSDRSVQTAAAEALKKIRQADE